MRGRTRNHLFVNLQPWIDRDSVDATVEMRDGNALARIIERSPFRVNDHALQSFLNRIFHSRLLTHLCNLCRLFNIGSILVSENQ